ncbi:MAG: YraN family protein [Candidatus Omnitrophota bacterium]|nr:MAG: YraN family protein [Candidatus Omnitrophota bacterium]
MNDSFDYFEDLAVNYLKQRGYKVLERNFRSFLGEIDIIAKDKGVLCFVEVKGRTFPYKYGPLEAVSKSKRKKIERCAFCYLKQKGLFSLRARFDVLSVVKFREGLEFYLIKGAFNLEE